MHTIEEKFIKLIEIMSTLRSKEGCPWDREQNHKSLRQHLIEEAYEVIETIDENRLHELPGELGDLLLQVVFHAQMAKEAGLFDIADVLDAINTKLIRRHPHVFGDVQIDTAEEQIVFWEQMKIKREGKKSAIEGVPKSAPSLLRSYRIQNKAATVGFDWPHIKPVWEKIQEEILEFKEAAETGDKDHTEEELGDLLFSIVNVSRFLKINPEDALRRTIEKFCDRFVKVEKVFQERGIQMQDVSLEELDRVWEQVKRAE